MREQKRQQILQKVGKMQRNEHQGEGKKGKWDALVTSIVRPPRKLYELDDLGSTTFAYNGKFFYRKDFEVMHGDKKLDVNLFYSDRRCSHVCLYLHGNMSNKLQSIHLIQYLPPKVALACFDFLGCGINDQTDIISLGIRESEQTATVFDFFTQQGYEVIIWGRSMGAATALLHGRGKIIIADSAFRNFKTLCKQVAKRYSPKFIPNCCIDCFFPCIFSKLKKDVHARAQYDLQLLDIKKAMSKIDPKTLIILLSAHNDELIDQRNSQKLLTFFPGQKKHLLLFEGDHNSGRPEQVFLQIQNLMVEHLHLQAPSFKQVLSKSTEPETRESGVGMMRQLQEENGQHRGQFN